MAFSVMTALTINPLSLSGAVIYPLSVDPHPHVFLAEPESRACLMITV
ncbi:MAG: hypothetical protein M1431_03980 [Candidatus Thermoplasmatota archaeon]|nr:hypothetical protein [Candidatus Thermoplasmatota archaeon]